MKFMTLSPQALISGTEYAKKAKFLKILLSSPTHVHMYVGKKNKRMVIMSMQPYTTFVTSMTLRSGVKALGQGQYNHIHVVKMY